MSADAPPAPVTVKAQVPAATGVTASDAVAAAGAEAIVTPLATQVETAKPLAPAWLRLTVAAAAAPTAVKASELGDTTIAGTAVGPALGDETGLGDAPGLGDDPGLGEPPGLGETPGLGEAPGLGCAVGDGEATGGAVGFPTGDAGVVGGPLPPPPPHAASVSRPAAASGPSTRKERGPQGGSEKRAWLGSVGMRVYHACSGTPAHGTFVLPLRGF